MYCVFPDSGEDRHEDEEEAGGHTPESPGRGIFAEGEGPESG
jgi:hypothetical protein